MFSQEDPSSLTISQNKNLREKIDVLRKEKLVIEDIYKKLKIELEDKKKSIEATIIEAGKAHYNRDQAEKDLTILQEKAEIQKVQFEKAEANYEAIIANYRDGILIDDAYFKLAELYEKRLNLPEKAKPLYEQIIFNHADSIYFVEARKRFRALRGDAIN